MTPMAYRVVAAKRERRKLIAQTVLFLLVVFAVTIVLSFVGVTVVPAQ